MRRIAFATFLLLAIPVTAAEQTPEQTCMDQLRVSVQYGQQQNLSRNALERELAIVRSQVAILQAQVKELSPKTEKPAAKTK